MSKNVRASVEEALDEIRSGRMVILVDDEDRENEGDLTMAAQFATPEAINFMATYGRGLICLPLTSKRCDELELVLMSGQDENKSRFGTAFTLSIEAKEGISTGISAADRAHTIRIAADEKYTKDDLVVPGHIFPLRARDGGVFVRTGQTEGSVDLAKLAGLNPSAVICEIMNEDGTMARMPQLEVFAEKHNLKIVTIADLIAYRLVNDSPVEKLASALLPTDFGNFNIMGFKNSIDGQEAVVLAMGDLTTSESALVRVHSSCLTGDVFASKRCDCGAQLHAAMAAISKAGRGVIVYMFQEGRGIGIINKIKAYSLQDDGYDTVEANQKLGFKADLREYGFGAQVIAKLGIKKMRLMTNNPVKIKGLAGYGLEVVERVPVIVDYSDESQDYMRTKQEKLGHLLGLVK